MSKLGNSFPLEIHINYIYNIIISKSPFLQASAKSN